MTTKMQQAMGIGKAMFGAMFSFFKILTPMPHQARARVRLSPCASRRGEGGFAIGLILAMISMLAVLSAIGLMTSQQFNSATRALNAQIEAKTETAEAITSIGASAVSIALIPQGQAAGSYPPNFRLKVVDPRILAPVPRSLFSAEQLEEGGCANVAAKPAAVFSSTGAIDCAATGFYALKKNISGGPSDFQEINGHPILIMPFVPDISFNLPREIVHDYYGGQGEYISYPESAVLKLTLDVDENAYQVHDPDSFATVALVDAPAYVILMPNESGAYSSARTVGSIDFTNKTLAQILTPGSGQSVIEETGLMLTSYLELELDARGTSSVESTFVSPTPINVSGDEFMFVCGSTLDEMDNTVPVTFDMSATSPYKNLLLDGTFQKKCLVEADPLLTVAIQDLESSAVITGTNTLAGLVEGAKLIFDPQADATYTSTLSNHQLADDAQVGSGTIAFTAANGGLGAFKYVREDDPAFSNATATLNASTNDTDCAGTPTDHPVLLQYDGTKFNCVVDKTAAFISDLELDSLVAADTDPDFRLVEVTNATRKHADVRALKGGTGITLSLDGDSLKIDADVSITPGLDALDVLNLGAGYDDHGSLVAFYSSGGGVSYAVRPLISADSTLLKIVNGNNVAFDSNGNLTGLAADGAEVSLAVDDTMILSKLSTALISCVLDEKLIVGDNPVTPIVETSYCLGDQDATDALKAAGQCPVGKVVVGFKNVGATGFQLECKDISSTQIALPASGCVANQLVVWSASANNFICKNTADLPGGAGGGFVSAKHEGTGAAFITDQDSTAPDYELKVKGIAAASDADNTNTNVSAGDSQTILGVSRATDGANAWELFADQGLLHAVNEITPLHAVINEITVIWGDGTTLAATFLQDIKALFGCIQTFDAACTTKFPLIAGLVKTTTSGTGESIVAGSDAASGLKFRQIKGEDGITVAANATDNTIEVSASGGVTPSGIEYGAWTGLTKAQMSTDTSEFNPACQYRLAVSRDTNVSAIDLASNTLRLVRSDAPSAAFPKRTAWININAVTGEALDVTGSEFFFEVLEPVLVQSDKMIFATYHNTASPPQEAGQNWFTQRNNGSTLYTYFQLDAASKNSVRSRLNGTATDLPPAFGISGSVSAGWYNTATKILYWRCPTAASLPQGGPSLLVKGARDFFSFNANNDNATTLTVTNINDGVWTIAGSGQTQPAGTTTDTGTYTVGTTVDSPAGDPAILPAYVDDHTDGNAPISTTVTLCVQGGQVSFTGDNRSFKAISGYRLGDAAPGACAPAAVAMCPTGSCNAGTPIPVNHTMASYCNAQLCPAGTPLGGQYVTVRQGWTLMEHCSLIREVEVFDYLVDPRTGMVAKNTATPVFDVAGHNTTISGHLPFTTTLQATSASSVTIGTGNKTFHVGSGKYFPVSPDQDRQTHVFIVDRNAPTNFMHGIVTSYDVGGNGDLIVGVTETNAGGAGTTAANWDIYRSDIPRYDRQIDVAQHGYLELYGPTKDNIYVELKRGSETKLLYVFRGCGGFPTDTGGEFLTIDSAGKMLGDGHANYSCAFDGEGKLIYLQATARNTLAALSPAAQSCTAYADANSNPYAINNVAKTHNMPQYPANCGDLAEYRVDLLAGDKLFFKSPNSGGSTEDGKIGVRIMEYQPL